MFSTPRLKYRGFRRTFPILATAIALSVVLTLACGGGPAIAQQPENVTPERQNGDTGSADSNTEAVEKLSDADRDKLARIVKRLDSDDYAQRAAAESDLAELCGRTGPAIVPALKDYAETAGADAKRRIGIELRCLGELGHYWKLLRPLEVLGLPEIQGKKFVHYNTGEAWISNNTDIYFIYSLGWVLSETEKEITLLERTLCVRTYTRVYELDDFYDDYKDQIDHTVPAPGKYEEYEFEELCRSFIDAGPGNYFGAMHHARRGGLEHPPEMALLAYWALQSGVNDVAAGMVELADKSLDKSYDWRMDERPSLTNVFHDDVTTNLRYQAITDAGDGAPRPELLKKWRLLAYDLAPNEYESEALAMIPLYERLIAEDEEWKEPTEEELAAMTDEEKVGYWIFKLREADARQMNQPGMCTVVAPPGHWLWLDGGAGSKAGNALYELGWKAIPALIEHFEDPRPTRSYGFSRNFATSSYYLLRNGDACVQIFETITGLDIYDRTSTNGYMLKDGMAAECKAKALKWWEENRETGEFAWLTVQLNNSKDHITRRGLARRLLSNYAAAAPVLKDLAGEMNDDRLRGDIVKMLGELDYEGNAGWIRTMLELKKGPDTDYAAANLLWENEKDPSGFYVVLEDIEDAAGTGEKIWDEPYFLEGRSIVLLSTGIADIEKRLRRLAVTHKSDGVRAAIWKGYIAAETPVPEEVVRAISMLLDDTEWENSSGTFGGGYINHPRVRDFAAYYLARAIRRPELFPFRGTEDERDAQIEALKGSWREHTGKKSDAD